MVLILRLIEDELASGDLSVVPIASDTDIFDRDQLTN